MQQYLDLNTVTFVGIDAHPTTHTALAINRFEEEKGRHTFENTRDGIKGFLHWLAGIDKRANNILVGVEGSGGNGHALVSYLLKDYENVYEVNPLYTKQRRMLGTNGKKSDLVDAKLVAQVVIRKHTELPKLTRTERSIRLRCLRKTIWHYDDIALQASRLKIQLQQLEREHALSLQAEERKVLALIIREKKKSLEQFTEAKIKLVHELSPLLQGHGDNLTTMKGIGTVLAAQIVAYANEVERFQTVWKFLQYAGIAPIEKSSGKTKRYQQNHKGNRNLNSAIYMIALNQIRFNPEAKAYFNKKVNEGKTKKHALRCVMKRIACIIYGMLKSGEAYREQ